MTEPLTDETIRGWALKLHSPGVDFPLDCRDCGEQYPCITAQLGQALLDAHASYEDAMAMLRYTSRSAVVAEADNAALVQELINSCVGYSPQRDESLCFICRAETAVPTEHKPECILAQPHPGAALLEHVAKLEAIVAAARNLCVDDDCCDKTRRLTAAIAALDAEPETAPDLVTTNQPYQLVVYTVCAHCQQPMREAAFRVALEPIRAEPTSPPNHSDPERREG